MRPVEGYMVTLGPSVSVSGPAKTWARHRVQPHWEQGAWTSLWLGAFTGLWLGLFPIAEFLLRPRSTLVAQTYDSYREASPMLAAALGGLILVGLAPSLTAAVLIGVDFRRVRGLGLVSLFVCLSIPLSYLADLQSRSVLYIALIDLVFASMIVLAAANLRAEPFLRALALALALTHAATLIAVVLDHDEQWGRLFGRNSPAYWGMVAQTAVFCTIALRGVWIRLALIALALGVLYWSQTRGSMVALAAGGAVGLLFIPRTSAWRVWIWLSIGACALAGVVIGSGFVLNDLMKLSDPARGLGTGLTGRASAWRETWDLFAAHPIFGVGYRQHEQYITSAVSAHNAYLATLADVGLVGTLAYGLFLGGGLAASISKARLQPDRSRVMSLCFLVGYAVNGLFERSALNTGNTYSMLMILLCAFAWRDDNPVGYLPGRLKRSAMRSSLKKSVGR